jgi:hypothetical protein
MMMMMMLIWETSARSDDDLLMERYQGNIKWNEKWMRPVSGCDNEQKAEFRVWTFASCFVNDEREWEQSVMRMFEVEILMKNKVKKIRVGKIN